MKTARKSTRPRGECPRGHNDGSDSTELAEVLARSSWKGEIRLSVPKGTVRLQLSLSGASIALAITVGLVISLHGYLRRLPDVYIKLGAGLMLLTLGTFWLLEGLGLKWPLGELSALPLFCLFLLFSLVAILVVRRRTIVQ